MEEADPLGKNREVDQKILQFEVDCKSKTTPELEALWEELYHVPHQMREDVRKIRIIEAILDKREETQK